MFNQLHLKSLFSASIFLLFFLVDAAFAQGTSTASGQSSVPAVQISTGDHEEWSYNLGMYEVNIRQYTTEGTFAAFAEHLDRLQDLGVGILWLMPVHPIGEENRLGTLGSYYSVKDFREINPEFGTKEDFQSLIDEIHNRGMYVLMDWVPNHTSWDNVLTESDPEFYVRENGEFIIPPGTNWSDVIQLDHRNDGLLDYMIDAMLYWVEEYGVDGFRYDAPSHVLEDRFLDDLNTALKEAKPDIFLLAEDNNVKWHNLGFDQTFAWGMYGFGHGLLTQIASGNRSAPDVRTHMNHEYQTFGQDAYRLYFTSNHDENSWEGTTTDIFGDAAEIFKVMTGTINGMPLIYSGQEAGLDQQLAFFYKDEINWGDFGHPNAEIYSALLHLKRENSALWNGSHGGPFEYVTTGNDDVLAFIRQNNEDKVFVVLNLSGDEHTVSFGEPSDYQDSYTEVFTNESVVIDNETALTLQGWEYLVYETDAAATSVLDEERPVNYSLKQNYPNPFNPSTLITYSIPESGHVKLEVFDISGRPIAVLEDGMVTSGSHTVHFDARGLASGMYIYRIKTRDFSETRQMLLIK